jgi:flavin-dependent dehydrogenase
MVVNKIDVLIIGAGPAGLSAAQELAAAGRDVMVVDKTPVLGRKVCSGILPFNREVQTMGIPESIIRSRSTQLSLTTRRATRNISYAQEPRISFTREALGQWMAERAAKAGAEIRIGVKIKRIDGTSAITDQNEVIYFNKLIGADGSLSLVRRHLGLPFAREVAIQTWLPIKSSVIRLKVDTVFIGPWAAYALPNGDLTVCGVGGDADRTPVPQMRRELEKWIREIGFQGKYSTEGFPLCATYLGHHFGNISLVGDAAGLMNEMTGIGIYPGWLSGQEVARQIINPDYPAPRLQELIRSKRKQRRIIRSLQFSPRLANLGYEVLSSLLSMNAFRNRFFAASFGGHS